ncbi:hypothetical protein JYU34_011910 [Plutella xylostella]|uniref:Uncharacterized protein n=1 Tax=Plutella xylostella TaxID=51655 RepID=A0ABQ7QE08_PLUXY|nr:hypothetical protein JYU34_011910 [Plutella xylostella]
MFYLTVILLIVSLATFSSPNPIEDASKRAFQFDITVVVNKMDESLLKLLSRAVRSERKKSTATTVPDLNNRSIFTNIACANDKVRDALGKCVAREYPEVYEDEESIVFRDSDTW